VISIYKLKPWFQQLLKPLLEMLYKAGVSANAITWSGILLSTVAGVLFWIHPYGNIFLLIPVVLLVRMAINALDGMMARTYNMQSKAGEMLNELGDVWSDLVLFLPLLQLKWLNVYVVLAFLFLSVINEFAGVMGKVIGGERRYDGPMGKSDRALLVGAFCLSYCCWKGMEERYGTYVFGIACVLLVLSTVIRIRKSLNHKRA
jgi:CDP-diacylglycerol---glycerol-3-phosphate 3-phosphatidyltransferase